MKNASARLYLCLDDRERARIAKAAALRRMAVSAFVRDAILREAETTIAAESVVVLSEQESRHFHAALDEPFRPNDRLKRAMDAASRHAIGRAGVFS